MKISKARTKIVIAIYAGLANMPDSIAKEYVAKLNEYGRTFDRSIYTIVIPDKTFNGLKVECLNPVIIDESQYERVDNIIKEAEEKLKLITLFK